VGSAASASAIRCCDIEKLLTNEFGGNIDSFSLAKGDVVPTEWTWTNEAPLFGGVPGGGVELKPSEGTGVGIPEVGGFWMVATEEFD
jgi:hypothetical protein